ncbi:MAG: flagellar hook-basal body complex protein [Acidobacteria bacterium]|nr:flagellar hook-basal body complex protein [Acidobacteriota bacterium]
MPSPFFTGLSGLRAHARAVEVVANNLANLNTIAFKGSRSDFRDLFYQQIGQSRSGVASQVGIGAAPITVSRRFEQGTIQNTGGLLDAAVQGEGFFIVRDGDLTLYTRAGNFQLNQDQNLVTLNGENVLGWVRDRATNTLDTGLPPAPITLQGNDRIEPTATTTLSVNANLQTGSTSPFSRPIEIFDSLGSPHILTLTFTPTAPTGTNSAAYVVTATLPANETIDLNTNATPLADPNVVAPAVTIEFDQNGVLSGASPTSATLDMTATTPAYAFLNGAGPLNVTWNFTDPLGIPRITSVAASSTVSDLSQNGSASAELVSIAVADGGIINGTYSDGRTLELAQLALARFTNKQALQANGNNTFLRSAAAGEPLVGEASTGGLGAIVGLSLETSNVDIANEFTDLLTYQRGFQANSRVITTADELNQEALNLKR